MRQGHVSNAHTHAPAFMIHHGHMLESRAIPIQMNPPRIRSNAKPIPHRNPHDANLVSVNGDPVGGDNVVTQPVCLNAQWD